MSVLDKFLDAIKLNDDYDDEEFFDEEFEDDYPEEEVKPRKKFFDKFRSKSDDLDEEFADDEPAVKPSRQTAATKSTTSAAPKTAAKQTKSSSKITPMRNTRRSAATAMEVCVIKPVSMEDTREIADTLVDNCTVVLNLEGVDVDLAQRIIDFTSGSCYSLGGSLQKISSYIFIITPHNVDVSGDFQSILGDAIPSIRSNF